MMKFKFFTNAALIACVLIASASCNGNTLPDLSIDPILPSSAQTSPAVTPSITEPDSALNFTYTVNGNGVSITGYIGSSSHVTIPEMINGKSVTIIGYGAFYDCYNLTTITIPNQVTSISDEAFAGCSSLTRIIIPGSVTSIGKRVFDRCKMLSITVDTSNNHYKDIGGVLFTKDGAELIRYPAGIENPSHPEIPPMVFFTWSIQTKAYTIPDGVTHIDEGAFEGCAVLDKITIPSSVTNIGAGAFYGCSNLINIAKLDSVQSIGHSAFWGCSNLTSVVIPYGITNISDHIFRLYPQSR